MPIDRMARWGLVAALVVAAVCLTTAQEPAVISQAKSLALSAAVPVTPQVTMGTLPNGLRYYLRVNKQPANRVELRLAVNAGSVLEDDDQQGLAHMCEHMAFNGTKHFAKQEIVAFMESIGMRFGPSLNAFTSFDETVYMLQVPADKADVLDRAFLVLEDWAHNLSFDPAEIDKERGVIVEEWRLGRGANARMRDQQLPVVFAGSRYAERLPIGKKSVIETFKHERLKKFYTDWYRPDLMAVVVVGDFDKAAVEAMLTKHFATLPKATAPRPRPTYDLPDHPDTKFALATDKEATATTVSVYNKLPIRDQSTVGSYRDKIVERLAYGMLNRRLSDLSQKPDTPFVMAAAGSTILTRTKEAAVLNVAPKEGMAERALDALVTEAARAAKFGFTTSEFDRQKLDTLRTYERYFLEKDKHESAQLADEYVRNFTQKESLPSPELEFAMHQRFLPEITIAEVNAVAKTWLSERSRVVLSNAPEKAGVAPPDQTKLAAVLNGAATKALTAYVDTVADQKLMDTLPTPGSIVKTTNREAFGITEWDLSNGIKVVLKPTTFKQDEVVFRATGPGGTSLASDDDYWPANTASSVIPLGGLGKFSAIDLRKVLAGKVVSVRPVIGEVEDGLMGTGSPKDLETLFQLVYLTVTAPRADPTVFAAFVAQGKAVLANQQASPEYAFSERLQRTLSQDHLRGMPMTAATLDKLNLDKSLAFYKERFADVGDFTFVFVGSFDLPTLKPLVERYLASLPSAKRHDAWKDVGLRPPSGIVEKVVKKGLEPKSQAAIVFNGPFKWNRDERVAIRALSMVLETRLREVVREDMSGTYGISVSPNAAAQPYEHFSLAIQFGCNPVRTDELIKAVMKEVDAMRSTGPTEKQVSDVREALIRDFETNTKQNAYLLSQLYLRYQVPQDLGEFFSLGEFYKSIDAKFVAEAAKKYLPASSYVKVTLLPETGTPTPASAPAK